MHVADVEIKTEYITLDNLLKFAGLVGTGGEAKVIISSGEVKVDGEIEIRRGRKVRPGSCVTFGNVKINVRSVE